MSMATKKALVVMGLVSLTYERSKEHQIVAQKNAIPLLKRSQEKDHQIEQPGGNTMPEMKCKSCGRQLSSAGEEVGLMIYSKKHGKQIIVCATLECSGIPEKTTVGELQNLFLR